MKMFKKLMAVALVGVMALSMLTGCAVSDAIAEKQAEKALEDAYTMALGQDVEFTQVDKDAYKKAAATLKQNIKDKKATYAEATNVASETTGDYTVVVVPAPKSATTLNAWKKAVGAVIKAAPTKSIYLEGTIGNGKALKGKVNIQVVEGVKADDKDKSQDYVIFVFAATPTAYNK